MGLPKKQPRFLFGIYLYNLRLIYTVSPYNLVVVIEIHSSFACKRFCRQYSYSEQLILCPAIVKSGQINISIEKEFHIILRIIVVILKKTVARRDYLR